MPECEQMCKKHCALLITFNNIPVYYFKHKKLKNMANSTPLSIIYNEWKCLICSYFTVISAFGQI